MNKSGGFDHTFQVHPLFNNVLEWNPNELHSWDTFKINSPIPAKFTNGEEYKYIFEPILFEEIKENIVDSVNRDTKNFYVTRDQTIKSFGNCNITSRCTMDVEGKDLWKEILVLFTNHHNGNSAFGIVENVTPLSSKLEKGELKEGKMTVEIKFSNNKIIQNGGLFCDDGWYSFRTIITLSKFSRDIMAINSIKELPLCEEILKGCETDARTQGIRAKYPIDVGFEEIFKSKLNTRQIECVRSAHRLLKSITLILGPAGTDKEGVIQMLLSTFRQSFRDAVNRYPKMLVVAPSSYAIDEITRRVSINGLIGRDGKVYQPGIIRYGEGANDNKCQIVSKVSLSQVVGDKIQREKDDMCLETAGRYEKLRNLEKNARSKNKKDESLERDIANEMKKLRLSLEKEVIGSTEYTIFSTISSSGNSLILNNVFNFDLVIVYEACQATEPSILIPLKKTKKVVLVGDPLQSSTTVMSGEARRNGLDISLFERLQKTSIRPIILNEQNRISPVINKFISDTFYSGEIINGLDVMEYYKDFYIDKDFGVLAFYDIIDGKAELSEKSMSYYNYDEVDLAFLIIEAIRSRFKYKKNEDWYHHTI